MTELFRGNEVAGPTSTEVVDETPKGTIVIRSNCPPGSFDGLRLEEGLGRFAHYASIIHTVETFEKFASGKDGKVTLALAGREDIVGYCVGCYPAPDDRWSALGDLMYELAAIEVSRNYRGIRLAERLLQTTMDEDFFEDKIAYMQGFSWHWDIEGSGLTPAEYRSLMIKLYSKSGFREVYTNEPNICLRVENVMMIRVGSGVSPEDQRRFRYLRFGIKQ